MRDIPFSPRSRTIALWILVAAIVVFFWAVRGVLYPFIWAAITAYVLHPLVSWLTSRTKLPRVAWISLIFIAFLAAITVSGIYLVPLIINQINDLLGKAPDAITEFQDWLRAQGTIRLGNYNIEVSSFEGELVKWLREFVASLPKVAVPVLMDAVKTILHIIVYLLASFYMLLHARSINRGLRSLMPRHRREEYGAVMDRINHTLGAYLRGQLILIVLMSTVTFAGLSILQFRYALAVAVMTGFLEIFPLVGPLAAGTVAVLVGIFQPTIPFGWSPFTYALVIGLMYFVFRELEDYLVIPNIIGRIVHLHPLVVIFALLAAGSLAGVMGMLLAVPAAAVLKILLDYLRGKVSSPEPVADAASTTPDVTKEELEIEAPSGQLP